MLHHSGQPEQVNTLDTVDAILTANLEGGTFRNMVNDPDLVPTWAQDALIAMKNLETLHRIGRHVILTQWTSRIEKYVTSTVVPEASCWLNGRPATFRYTHTVGTLVQHTHTAYIHSLLI